MDEYLDLEAREILAIANAVEPLIQAYKKGELSPEEAEYLRAVMQSMWPTVQSVIAGMWERLEPILTKLDLWPPKEEES